MYRYDIFEHIVSSRIEMENLPLNSLIDGYFSCKYELKRRKVKVKNNIFKTKHLLKKVGF